MYQLVGIERRHYTKLLHLGHFHFAKQRRRRTDAGITISRGIDTATHPRTTGCRNYRKCRRARSGRGCGRGSTSDAASQASPGQKHLELFDVLHRNVTVIPFARIAHIAPGDVRTAHAGRSDG